MPGFFSYQQVMHGTYDAASPDEGRAMSPSRDAWARCTTNRAPTTSAPHAFQLVAKLDHARIGNGIYERNFLPRGFPAKLA
jgi:hypothetical protein